MRLTLLGTGNSAGMPLYGCDCERCADVKLNPELRRGPACAQLEVDGNKYLIDAGLMDITDKYQAGTLAGIFLTHFHPDHVQGLFHLRWGIGSKIPVHCPPDSTGCADLFTHPGILDFQKQKKFVTFEIGNLKITPLPLIHSKVTFGYLFEYDEKRIAYLTDTKGLPPKTLSWLKPLPLDLLVIDTSFSPLRESSGHNNLNDTLALYTQLQPTRTVLTHISHEFDVWLNQNENLLHNSLLNPHDNQIVFPL